MSTKLFIKNLNVSEIEKNITKEFDKINLNLNVNELIERIANEYKVSPYKLELLYRGELMERDKILNDYIKDSDETGLVLIENKQKIIENAAIEIPSEKDIQELCQKIGATFKSKKKRRQLESFLKNTQNIQNIVKSVPSLNQDPIAYSFVQSIDLVLQLSDLNKAKNLINNYPNIFHGVKQLVKVVCDEIKNNPINNDFVNKGAFSIDDMSEDEDNANAANAAYRRTNSGPSISQDHFAAVLAAINQQQQQQQQRQQPRNSNLNRDYFENVMQHVLQQSLTNTSHPPPPPQQSTASSSSSLTSQNQANQQQQPNLSDEQLALSLEKMHEFGFWDDDKNMRALFITEGNVEAAISLLVENADF